MLQNRQLLSKEKADWTFRVPGLLVLLAAKRTDINDNKKNTRYCPKEKENLITVLHTFHSSVTRELFFL